jgi:hypothetical protein
MMAGWMAISQMTTAEWPSAKWWLAEWQSANDRTQVFSTSKPAQCIGKFQFMISFSGWHLVNSHSTNSGALMTSRMSIGRMTVVKKQWVSWGGIEFSNYIFRVNAIWQIGTWQIVTVSTVVLWRHAKCQIKPSKKC